jgi:hypothetical protein
MASLDDGPSPDEDGRQPASTETSSLVAEIKRRIERLTGVRMTSIRLITILLLLFAMAIVGAWLFDLSISLGPISIRPALAR